MVRNLLTDEEWTVFAPFLTEAIPASGVRDVLLQALGSTPTRVGSVAKSVFHRDYGMISC